jgi:hypothetical protein
MSLEKLLKELIEQGKLKKQNTNIHYLDNLLLSAKRNFEAASVVKNKIDEAAFKLVYDGLLQIGRLILLINGYRPHDGGQHKTTFMVAGALLGDEYSDLISKIQKFRIKRNDCIYEPTDFISHEETEAIFETSREFWKTARDYLKKKNPQLKLFGGF